MNHRRDGSFSLYHSAKKSLDVNRVKQICKFKDFIKYYKMPRMPYNNESKKSIIAQNVQKPRKESQVFYFLALISLATQTSTTRTPTKTLTRPKSYKWKITDFDSFLDNFVDFLYLWPLEQWIFSLITLLLLYVFAGHYYNKKLMASGGWISVRTRVIMIILDLVLNLVIGVYYMQYRETLFGAFMMRCPIAISPLIFGLEFLVVVWYYKKYTLPKEKEFRLKQKNEQDANIRTGAPITINNLEIKKELNPIQTNLVSTNTNLESTEKINSSQSTAINNNNDSETEHEKDSEFVPSRARNTLLSITLQKTLQDKFKAAWYQWSRWGRILDEPTGEEREILRKEINYRYNVKQKKISSTTSVKPKEKDIKPKDSKPEDAKAKGSKSQDPKVQIKK